MEENPNFFKTRVSGSTRVFVLENPGFRVPSFFTNVSDNQLYTSLFEQNEPMAGSKLVGLTVFEALKSYSK